MDWVEAWEEMGLSPRGRGNPPFQVEASRPYRSIPAWAGEPRLHLLRQRRNGVYPRVGGGTVTRRPPGLSGLGLSPRGRGNQGWTEAAGVVVGSIPAWAGEPRRPMAATPPCRVYPRVGGGTRLESALDAERRGLSPRGRGNQHLPLWLFISNGSIPAWAGEPVTPANNALVLRVYPRVGGGTRRESIMKIRPSGLSPRGRGNRGRKTTAGPRPGSIPAWAGEPYPPLRFPPTTAVYPRVGGGTWSRAARYSTSCGLSPRGRGNLHRTFPTVFEAGSIPAWAGEPRNRPRC